MTLRQSILWLAFLTFATYSTWVMWEIGYMGIWESGFTSSGTLQILIDLAIACFLICSWIMGDAKNRGINPYPWMIATFATGTLAPLVYLLIREYRPKSVPGSASTV